MLLEIILLVSLTFPGHLRQIFGLVSDFLQLFSVASPAFSICALNILSFVIRDVVPPIIELLQLCSVNIYSPLVQPVFRFCSRTLCSFANSVPTVWLSSALPASIGHFASIINSASIISLQLLDCFVAIITSSTRNVSACNSKSSSTLH